MPWKPEYPGEFPTLGWEMLSWYSEMLARPDRGEYEPLVLTNEQAQFILDFYRLDPRTGRFVYRSAILSRAKKWGKSPITGAIGVGEGLGPVLFDGWDANGRPVGKPWLEVMTPLVQFAATEENQALNAFNPMLEMIRMGPVMDYYDVDPLDSFVALPRGRMEYITAAGRSKEGQRPVFVALDQTESWDNAQSRHLAEVVRRNLSGTGGRSLETPNSYVPGSNSVAEESFKIAEMMAEGKTKVSNILVDHREAPAETDLADRNSLREGLLYAYGDSAMENGGWRDLEPIIDDILNPRMNPQHARQYFLNQITQAADAYVSQPEMRAIVDSSKRIEDGDTIVLGFDGSRGRVRGKADATALVGMRVSDKHLFEVGVWEAGPNDSQDWQPNVLDVDGRVEDCFQRFNVIGFYADPSGWSGQVAAWEAKYHRRLRVKASRSEPIAAWPRGKDSRVSEMVEQLRQAIVAGEISMSQSSALLRHFMNARRRATRSGYLLYKEFPESPDKIDATYASMLAYKACLDAIAAGIGARRTKKKRGSFF
nr:MAG: terminase large subunit [Caudoviricetes sp.]